MALILLVDAAIRAGCGVELIESFGTTCPKPGETRILPLKQLDGLTYVDEDALVSYLNYLAEPWPIRAKETRPYLPKAIRDDIKAESHLACAICGHMDGGEVAHIEDVSETRNNSPANLIFLCPNHHTKYDYGYKPNSNVTLEEVRAAKVIKQHSRRRVLRFEANTTRLMRAVIELVAQLNGKLTGDISKASRSIYETEMRALLAAFPDLTGAGSAAAKADSALTDTDKQLKKIAPSLTQLARSVKRNATGSDVRATVQRIVHTAKPVLIDLDEVDCPHCGGRGMRGMAGSLCSFCKGSCYVSTSKAESYDESALDEVSCPRCHGKCQTGLRGDTCIFCRGDGFVSKEEASDYDEEELSEVECLRCGGRGTIGLTGTFCPLCKGSCFIPRDEAENFSEKDLDEKSCPRCHGRGTTGLVGDICIYCKGDGVVTQQAFVEYDESDLSERKCPHCNGRGVRGLTGTYCSFCKGSQFVSVATAESYDENEIDEVSCPRCGGSGQTGLTGDTCRLCKGDCYVTHEMAVEYNRKYGQ